MSRKTVKRLICEDLGQQEHEFVCQLLRESPFSIAVDESTDIGSRKALVVICRTRYKLPDEPV